jgi:hypothetical protein
MELAQQELTAAEIQATIVRDNSCLTALMVKQSTGETAEVAFLAATEPARLAYMSEFDSANQEYSIAEQAAWNVCSGLISIAEQAFNPVEQSASDDYQTGLAGLNAQQQLLSQNDPRINVALQAWRTRELVAWTTYTGSLAQLSNTPTPETRQLEPDGPQAQVFVAQVAQPLFPRRLAEIREARRLAAQTLPISPIQQLRTRITGFLTGDRLDRVVYQRFNNPPMQASENVILLTINGILTSRAAAQAMLDSVLTFNTANPTPAIRRVEIINGTHGARDFVQIGLNETQRTTLADYQAAVQIELAAQALRGNGNNDPAIIKRIIVVAHSQGTEIFFNALRFLSLDTRAMIEFRGVGSERFVPDNVGLASAVNYYFANDLVASTVNFTPGRLLEVRNRGYTYEVHNLGNSPLAGLATHFWQGNYSQLFDTVGRIRRPDASRREPYPPPPR